MFDWFGDVVRRGGSWVCIRSRCDDTIPSFRSSCMPLYILNTFIPVYLCFSEKDEVLFQSGFVSRDIILDGCSIDRSNIHHSMYADFDTVEVCR